jgi:hypothetical protein
MMGNDTNAKFLLFQELLQRLAGEIEKLAIESGACEKLAISKGATSQEIHQAKESALADPVMRGKMKEQYSRIWNLLLQSGTDAFTEETFEDFPSDGPSN